MSPRNTPVVTRSVRSVLEAFYGCYWENEEMLAQVNRDRNLSRRSWQAAPWM